MAAFYDSGVPSDFQETMDVLYDFTDTDWRTALVKLLLFAVSLDIAAGFEAVTELLIIAVDTIGSQIEFDNIGPELSQLAGSMSFFTLESLTTTKEGRKELVMAYMVENLANPSPVATYGAGGVCHENSCVTLDMPTDVSYVSTVYPSGIVKPDNNENGNASFFSVYGFGNGPIVSPAPNRTNAASSQLTLHPSSAQPWLAKESKLEQGDKANQTYLP